MSKKIELSISTKYVPDWTYIEAVRELLQNAKDREIENPESVLFTDYDSISNVLTIGNKDTELTVGSILIGSTSKAGDRNTIGQHGEGYKLALMVLAREGRKVFIDNYKSNQKWTCRISKSRTFEDFQTPVIVIDDMYSESDCNDLVIRVTNISPSEYAEIVKHTLWLRSDGVNTYDTTEGQILLDESEKGNVYVEGLYVCSFLDVNYGYNFKASVVSLDRDRRLISSFDLSWVSSKMWAETEDLDKVYPLIETGALEVEYMKNFISQDFANMLFEYAVEKFASGNNKDSLYFVTASDFNQQKTTIELAGRTPAVCSNTLVEIINSSNIDGYERNLVVDESSMSLKDRLKSIYKTLESVGYDDSVKNELVSIIDTLED